jgi:hypothetical protein
VTIPNPQHVAVYIGLDQGEAEVLALAEAHPPRLVVIDELRGRRYALEFISLIYPGLLWSSRGEIKGGSSGASLA